MENTARYYLAATNEFDQGRVNEKLWAKAITLEKGDAKRAKYTYIQHRVKQFEQAMAGSDSEQPTQTMSGGDGEGAAPTATMPESGARRPVDSA
jgi:hypothetical protein